MNFKINNISFGAKFSVWGKQTPKETQNVFDRKIDKLDYNARVATQAQEYLQEDELIKCYIETLPEDTFVRLHTGVIDGENKREDKILDFTPFLSFETKSINEQINITRALNGGDTLELSLNQMGVLDKKPIINFFENLVEFYCHQK